jgi:ribonuclease P protein component
MLKKDNRLAKARDIKTALAKGRTFFNPFYSIRFLPKSEGLRLTVVVSTKVFKRAVQRNRLKRILREHLRKNLPALRQGDYLISAKPKISALKEEDRLKWFLDLLTRIR